MVGFLARVGSRSFAFAWSVAAALSAAPLPARAMELTAQTQSTLDAQVPSRSDLDATISSMVQRGVIIDVSTPSTREPRIGAAPAKPISRAPVSKGTTQWRPAGQGGYAQGGYAPAQTKSGAPSHIPPAPAPPVSDAKPQAAEAEAEADQKASEAETDGSTESTESTDEAVGEASEHDALAPIDELSETPAPESDAPGDPIEPEYTGEAALDSTMPPAKPLSSAPKPSDATRTPLGEPDRPAKPDLTSPPASPEEYQDAEPAPPVKKSAPLPPLTQNQRALRDKVRRVLKHYYNRPLSVADRSPWEVMHAMLSFEVHSRVLQANRQPITAVGWLCFNQPCETRSLLYLNEDGQLRVKVGPALQGHHGQLLALLAQARVRSDYPMKVEGKDFTVADLIEVEKATCYPKTELTFKLIGLQRYLDVNAKWVNDQGMQWDFPTLVREELQQPVRSAACGGTHRLGGLALAVKKRRSSGLPVDGVYAEAERYVANYVNYAYSLQNPDGSFSTEWFKGPGRETDVDRRLKTTGHQLELLMYAGSEQQLTHYRTVRAVNYLSNIMYANRHRDWEAGPLGHAIHALVLYDRLVFAKYDGAAQATPSPMAHRGQQMQQGRAKR